MSSFTTWQKITRQAAVTGKVIDPRTQLPVAGATVVIKTMPDAYSKWLALRLLSLTGRPGAQRPDTAVTVEDGCFSFSDLPDGSYTVEITSTDRGRRFGVATQAFTVARDGDGNIPLDIALIQLPPTAISGTIVKEVTGEDGVVETSAVPMARVEIQGTLERTFANASGQFYLTDIEPGERRLSITASGYQSSTATVVVVKGEITEMGSFVLAPSYVTT